MTDRLNLLQKNLIDSEVAELTGGHMNEVYLVKTPEGATVYKALRSNSHEPESLMALQCLPFVPRLKGVEVIDETQFLLTNYIQGAIEVRYLLQKGISHNIKPAEFGALAAQMLMQIQSYLPGKSHGDFTTKNIITNGDGFFVIDFEAAHEQSALEDIAWFIWYNAYHHPLEAAEINNGFLSMLPGFSKSALRRVVLGRIERIINSMIKSKNFNALSNWQERQLWTQTNFLV